MTPKPDMPPPTVVAALRALVRRLCYGGGIHGNPYCCLRVKDALQALAIHDGLPASQWLEVETDSKEEDNV